MTVVDVVSSVLMEVRDGVEELVAVEVLVATEELVVEDALVATELLVAMEESLLLAEVWTSVLPLLVSVYPPDEAPLLSPTEALDEMVGVILSDCFLAVTSFSSVDWEVYTATDDEKVSVIRIPVSDAFAGLAGTIS